MRQRHRAVGAGIIEISTAMFVPGAVLRFLAVGVPAGQFFQYKR